MNVILLHSNHRHVSATHVTIFMVVRTRIPIQLHCVEITPYFKNIFFGFNVLLVCILVDTCRCSMLGINHFYIFHVPCIYQMYKIDGLF